MSRKSFIRCKATRDEIESEVRVVLYGCYRRLHVQFVVLSLEHVNAMIQRSMYFEPGMIILEPFPILCRVNDQVIGRRPYFIQLGPAYASLPSREYSTQ